MKCCRWTLALIGTVLVSGCSWITTFAIVNASRAPITISYTIGSQGTNIPACPDGYFLPFPRVVPVKEIDTLKGLAPEAQKADFTCEKLTRTVTLSLAPDQAVSLFSVGTYTGPDSERDYLLVLMKLSIKGDSGELQYGGRQLVRDFEKKSVALWTLTYK